ncbi:MAG: hypothetical protein QM778_33125 [Myxococcales bacterium]
MSTVALWFSVDAVEIAELRERVDRNAEPWADALDVAPRPHIELYVTRIIARIEVQAAYRARALRTERCSQH